MTSLAPYRKAIVAGIATALAFAIPVVDDGYTVSEILGTALAFLVGSGVTYQVPNAGSVPNEPQHRL